MDTANAIDDTPVMDEKGSDITPKSSEIVFDKVDFPTQTVRYWIRSVLLFLKRPQLPLLALPVQVRPQCAI